MVTAVTYKYHALSSFPSSTQTPSQLIILILLLSKQAAEMKDIDGCGSGLKELHKEFQGHTHLVLNDSFCLKEYFAENFGFIHRFFDCQAKNIKSLMCACVRVHFKWVTLHEVFTILQQTSCLFFLLCTIICLFPHFFYFKFRVVHQSGYDSSQFRWLFELTDMTSIQFLHISSQAVKYLKTNIIPLIRAKI